MDKKTSSLKIQIVGTLKTSLIFAFLAITIFQFELSYMHTRDSSRADSIFSIILP